MYEKIVNIKTIAYGDHNVESKVIRQDIHVLVRFYLFIVLTSL